MPECALLHVTHERVGVDSASIDAAAVLISSPPGGGPRRRRSGIDMSFPFPSPHAAFDGAGSLAALERVCLRTHGLLGAEVGDALGTDVVVRGSFGAEVVPPLGADVVTPAGADACSPFASGACASVVVSKSGAGAGCTGESFASGSGSGSAFVPVDGASSVGGLPFGVIGTGACERGADVCGDGGLHSSSALAACAGACSADSRCAVCGTGAGARTCAHAVGAPAAAAAASMRSRSCTDTAPCATDRLRGTT